jgi:hypothetical protein
LLYAGHRELSVPRRKSHMKRSILVVLAAAALVGTTALAETSPDAKSGAVERRVEKTRYADATERWRGRPAQRAALSHPADTATGSEKVYELVPSVNFMLEGQTGGAFVVPRF